MKNLKSLSGWWRTHHGLDTCVSLCWSLEFTDTVSSLVRGMLLTDSCLRKIPRALGWDMTSSAKVLEKYVLVETMMHIARLYVETDVIIFYLLQLFDSVASQSERKRVLKPLCNSRRAIEHLRLTCGQILKTFKTWLIQLSALILKPANSHVSA